MLPRVDDKQKIGKTDIKDLRLKENWVLRIADCHVVFRTMNNALFRIKKSKGDWAVTIADNCFVCLDKSNFETISDAFKMENVVIEITTANKFSMSSEN